MSRLKYVKYIDFAEHVLKDCGEIARKWHGKKSPDSNLYLNEVVSSYINDFINKSLKNHFPEHRLFTKGSIDSGSRGYEWICDPLDGAFIYTKGLTSVVISMTLVHDGVPIVACIYQPFRDEMYVAVKGGGVTKNSINLGINEQKLEKFACINEEWWPAAAYDVDKVVHRLSRQYLLYPLHIASVVYSACLISEGVLTATLFGGRLVGKNHEAAAVMLLMEESGGKYTDLNGNKIGFEGVMHGFIISSSNAYADVFAGVKETLGDVG